MLTTTKVTKATKVRDDKYILTIDVTNLWGLGKTTTYQVEHKPSLGDTPAAIDFQRQIAEVKRVEAEERAVLSESLKGTIESVKISEIK